MDIISTARDVASITRNIGPRFALKLPAMYAGREPIRTRIPGRDRDFLVRPRTSDLAVCLQILARREYDLSGFPQHHDIQRYYEAVVDTGRAPLIIDAGANNGASAVWFSTLYPRSQIVALEPDADNVEICRANAESPQVRVLRAAIGGEEGSCDISQPNAEKWALTVQASAEGSIPMLTVESIQRQYADCPPFIVKVDIEGFEKDVFGKDDAWIDRTPIIIIEPHDWLLPGQGTSRSFQRAMGQRDFDLLIRGENLIYVNQEFLSVVPM